MRGFAKQLRWWFCQANLGQELALAFEQSHPHACKESVFRPIAGISDESAWA